MAHSTRRPPELEQRRHRVFDLVVLPMLGLVTLVLIYLAITAR